SSLFVSLTREHVVIQAPACAHVCHGVKDTTAVVFMMRNVYDIIASRDRIGWAFRDLELSKYPPEFRMATSAETKYLYWERVQKPLVAHQFEIEYESMASHPLWVAKERRVGFTPRQWRE